MAFHGGVRFGGLKPPFGLLVPGPDASVVINAVHSVGSDRKIGTGDKIEASLSALVRLEAKE